MRKALMALRAQRQILEPDPRKVSTPEEFNAHLDVCIDTLSKMKVEVDEAEPCAPEAEEPEQQLELDSQREERGGRDRMERGGQDRSED